jgi:hypothetical protein
MLKSISSLGTVLNKIEQKSINGGSSDFLCIAICGPGDGNTPIYDDNPFDDSPISETVGCICGS